MPVGNTKRLADQLAAQVFLTLPGEGTGDARPVVTAQGLAEPCRPDIHRPAGKGVSHHRPMLGKAAIFEVIPIDRRYNRRGCVRRQLQAVLHRSQVPVPNHLTSPPVILLWKGVVLQPSSNGDRQRLSARVGDGITQDRQRIGGIAHVEKTKGEKTSLRISTGSFAPDLR